jgi:fission process protein 1
VTAAYGVSWAYLIGDVAFTTYKAREFGPSPLEAANMSEPTRLSLVAVKRSVFQGIASMALPAFTIHTAVKQASKALRNSQNVQLKRWGPTAVGLGIVPALPFLFDHPVSDVLVNGMVQKDRGEGLEKGGVQRHGSVRYHGDASGADG